MHTTDIVSFLLSGLPEGTVSPVVSFLLDRLNASPRPSVVEASVGPAAVAAVLDTPEPISASVEALPVDRAPTPAVAPVDEWRRLLQERGVAPVQQTVPVAPKGKLVRRRPTAAPASAPQGWAAVVDHLPQLERIAGRMARVDARLDAGDLLQELVADLVSSAALFDAARGPWLTWAKTRCWLARTRALRILNRQEPRTRASLSSADPEDRDTATVRQISIGLGEWGTAARCEAIADLQALYDRATPDGRRELLARIRGENTGRGAEDRLDEASRGAAMGMDLRG